VWLANYSWALPLSRRKKWKNPAGSDQYIIGATHEDLRADKMAEAELHKVIKHLRNVLVMQDAARMTDGDLLQRYLQRRDEAAFEALVRKHGPMVLAVCRRVLRNLHDAEDAFQATFLVLVRKASSLRSPSRVGNWLYGVAFRTAQEAKRAALKRRTKEAKAMPRTGASEDSCSDLREALDQELERLPEKYRAVVVLCDLEGASGKEAARHLALPEGTVASRLARGRAMLGKRLARQGLMSGGALAGILAQDAASACVPTSLLVSTVKAATLFAAGQGATAGLISVEVAALTEGVLTAMLLSKVKIASVVLLIVVGTVLSTGTLMLSVSPAQEKDNQEKKAVFPPPAPQGVVGEATVTEVAYAYYDNDALGDEKFTGKRLKVTGPWHTVRGLRGGGFNSHGYMLTMIAQSGDRLSFRFGSDSRKQLAELKRGEILTIEGRCEGQTVEGGRTVEAGHGAISLSDCKIVSVKPPPLRPENQPILRGPSGQPSPPKQ
jgi:RNA polymerase sigma factor (sigma-70 family)